MRRAAPANRSCLPNHSPPRFYTAWVSRGHPEAVAACPRYPRKRTLEFRQMGVRQGPRPYVKAPCATCAAYFVSESCFSVNT
jgi:hypothetical protein